ncbi:MAG: DNA mismatch repair protein MutS [Firmicutes bacterium]|nr:DNA mismatch repair protein MutS [Bacillota bacterium]
MTQMMKQYRLVKDRHPNEIVFFRLGDFYEMFFDDALTASRELGIALTGRQGGMDEKVPMCGVPHHSSRMYIKRLIDRGFSVALCEQLTLPQKGKTMVERDVVKIITPGTIVDEDFLDQTRNNFVASVFMPKRGRVGAISWADISTGQFFVKTVDNDIVAILDTLAMINPREVICTETFKTEFRASPIASEFSFRPMDHYGFAFLGDTATDTILRYFQINSTSTFDIESGGPTASACGALLEFLLHTQKQSLKNITKIITVRNDDIMILDKNAREHLEITHQYRDSNSKYGSLLWTVDETKTPMGARLLSTMLSQPLRDIARINQRLDAVELLVTDNVTCRDLRACLSMISDLSRLSAKIASRDIMPRDILALRRSFDQIAELKSGLLTFSRGVLKNIQEGLTPLPETSDLIARAIADEPPAKLDDGGYIRDGYDATLDELRAATKMGHNWIQKLESSERVESQLKELKIGYNRVTGYYFEIPKRLSDQVPYRLQRIATTTNTERYITPELKELERKILGAADSARALEVKILATVRDELANILPTIQQNGELVAMLDTLCSLATAAVRNKWRRPKLNDGGQLALKNARHPVVEKIIGQNMYIANDCQLARGTKTTMIITGPNMAGKSTYMRSIACTVLLAHVGSFVPCDSAAVPITDRIFTRIGASDSLLTGQSTFMVECVELANICQNSTRNSLILLDEVGRGTGTKDGRALASAAILYITDKIGALTMFATHFHELNVLAQDNPRIKNFKALTSKINGQIVFLHKVEPGIEDNSFGLDVATLAGIPKEIISNARQLYDMDWTQQLTLPSEERGEAVVEKPKAKKVAEVFPIVSKLQNIDVDRLTPMEALVLLGDLSKEAKK